MLEQPSEPFLALDLEVGRLGRLVGQSRRIVRWSRERHVADPLVRPFAVVMSDVLTSDVVGV